MFQKIYIRVTTSVNNVIVMAETVSVRIDKPELKEIELLSVLERKTKSRILREILDKGIKEKKLEIAIEKFRNKETTAWKSARIADVPLTKFLDILVEKGIDFHYGIKELKEDFEGLI